MSDLTHLPPNVAVAIRSIASWDGRRVAGLKLLVGEAVAEAAQHGLVDKRGRPHDARWALGQAASVSRVISSGCVGIWNASDPRPLTVDLRDRRGDRLSIRDPRDGETGAVLVLWKVVDDSHFNDLGKQPFPAAHVCPAAHPRA